MIITSPVNEPVSPTVLERWMKCPSYGWLSQRYQPVGAKLSPYKLLGIVIAQSLETWLKDLPQPVELIRDTLTDNWPPDLLDWPLDTLIELATKGYEKAKRTLEMALRDEHILGVELELDKYHTRIDLLTTRENELIVTDHKVHYKYDAKYATSNLIQSEVSWQLWDYAYRASILYNRPVTHIRTHAIYLTPSPKSILHEVKIDESMIETWHLGAENEWLTWSIVHKMDLKYQTMRTTSCYSRYGRCEFFDFCWLAQKDETKAQMLYDKKVKR